MPYSPPKKQSPLNPNRDTEVSESQNPDTQEDITPERPRLTPFQPSSQSLPKAEAQSGDQDADDVVDVFDNSPDDNARKPSASLTYLQNISTDSLDSSAGYIDHRTQPDLPRSASVGGLSKNDFFRTTSRKSLQPNETITESPQPLSPRTDSPRKAPSPHPNENTRLTSARGEPSYSAIQPVIAPNSPALDARGVGSPPSRFPNVLQFAQNIVNVQPSNGYERIADHDFEVQSSVDPSEAGTQRGSYVPNSTIASRRPSFKAEEDVCFPMDMDPAVGNNSGVLGSQYLIRDRDGINYEELDEYLAQETEKLTSDAANGGVKGRQRRLSQAGTRQGSYYRRRPNQGADKAESKSDRPHRFTFFSDGLDATIHARSLAEIPREDQSFKDLINAGETFWLDVLSPTDDEMKVLSKVFGIHPLTTEDIQMEESREKIELFRSYYLVCFRSFDQDPYSPTYLEPLNMYMVVFRRGILSFHFQPTPHPTNVRRRIRQLKDYISVTSDWISYALIDDITDAFAPLIRKIEFEVDSIDELTLLIKEGSQSDMLTRIGTVRKKVMGLLRLLGSKADVIKGLSKRCNEQWEVAPRSEIGLYLGDIQDHVITMRESLTHFEKILSRSHSNYLAQISIDMTQVNNQTNDVLSRLTVLGTILVPM